MDNFKNKLTMSSTHKNNSRLGSLRNGYISAEHSCVKSEKSITGRDISLTPNQVIALNRELTLKLYVNDLR